jgi:serine/threonine protein phosphatase PrpC
VVARLCKTVDVMGSNVDPATLHERMHGGEAHLMLVADGVGGRAGGAEASRTAITTALEYVAQATGCYHRLEMEEEHAFIDRLQAAVLKAHDRLRDEHGTGEWTPATTLTMVMLVGLRAYLVHVGDTRAYYLRRHRIFQITRDQTFGQYLLDSGAVTDEQVANSPMGRTLASALGSSEVNPTVGLIDLEPGDTLMLCSDGLTRHVSDESLRALLDGAPNARAACEALLAAAIEGGGSDNITVVVARAEAGA